jgi:hypothetical protein
MLELKKSFKNLPTEDSVTLLCVVKNEILPLPYFISYYKKLGVSHFTFIDNDSSDGTLEFLLSYEETECQVYHTSDSYAENLFGVGWVNEILNSQLKNKWCIVVDVDELLLLKNNLNFYELRKKMIKQNANILVTTLLDFYPKNFDNSDYISGESFLIHSDYYDKMDTDFKNVFMEIQDDDSITLKGGVRSRVTKQIPVTNESPCLTKKSFFKYDFHATHKLSEGMHWLLPHQFKDWRTPGYEKMWKESNPYLKFYDKILLLGHFKYLKPNIFEQFKKRIDAAQDWDGGIGGKGPGQEYKLYTKHTVSTFYDKNISKKFLNISELYDDTINKITNYVSDIKRFREKNIILVISEQRHGSTTLCEKINELPNTISLFEAFGLEGFFYVPKQWKQDLEPHLCRLINGTSWLRDVDTISFKVFSDHGVKLESLMELTNLKKVIFLKRELKDSYNSLKQTLEEGNWKTNPDLALGGVTGYDSKMALQDEFWAVDSSENIISFEKYKFYIENWMNRSEKLANAHKIPNQTVWFWDAIHGDITNTIG